ncbi:hypothetical protein [Halostella salina]|uniref:hypothetical protein n=1 Tax=Halostella salina TaxID=1547897 RepID=UPI000EF83B94|nr:hypothetical protein [Halostella salina]
MRRRIWLGLCVATLTSGCLGRIGPPKKTIAWLRLRNNRDEPHTLDVAIERNDEEVFGETYRLGTTADQATVRVDDPVETRGRYSVDIDTGTQVAHLHPSEFADLDISEPCVGIEYTLHEAGTTGFQFEPVPEC